MPNSDDEAVLIAHVDLDAFFASCEQRDNPEYRGSPVVVGALPGTRGVVAASSYEARKFGIHSAMPISEAYRRCPDAVYLRPNMDKYREASRQVFAALKSITPVIEKASIDEAYLELTGMQKLLGTPEEIGRAIKQAVHENTGLSASVGMGPNRLIAKLGSDYRKPDGLTIIAKEAVAEFLAPMPVRNLRGAGPQTQKIFRRLGIKTIGELRLTSPDLLLKHLGQNAADNFRKQALGHGSTTVRIDRQRKSISKERTFQTDVTTISTLHDDLRSLTREIAHSARQKNLAGRVIKLKIRFSDFQTHSRQVTLTNPTNDEREIAVKAWALFSNGDLPDKPVRLIGVGLSDWAPFVSIQADMFTDTARQTDQKLLDTMDSVATKFGAGKLQIGTSRKRQK